MRVSVTGEIPDSPEFTSLERAVLDCAVAAAGSDSSALQEQLERAQVAARTPSGVGFVSRLRVPDDCPVAGAAAALPVVYGEHPQLRSGAEFMLQLKDGRLHTIEAFCFAGMWPADENLFQLAVRP
ncbi:MAG: hypothetical protein QNJ73_00625 [Gammaproteobacteria bacterium]|nr:hypothetical protein [Gammaproteobacteria bacterium]